MAARGKNAVIEKYNWNADSEVLLNLYKEFLSYLKSVYKSINMLQALIHKGSVKAEEVPVPSVGKGRVLIRVVNSCISAGTEMASVSSTGKSPVRIMREQPEKIRKIFDLIRSEGLRKISGSIQIH